ncbi:hypothetical protein [Paenibacillus piscarius]|uniref:hypothetical protein n=1 Tax=Paenibacillus piscarius TaxID=1089681 RepID=UPI001EE8B462|nr:hypothetical protein [Paenibacillus piscarius]
MGNEFNKTEADFAYERYTKMGSVSPEEGIPLEELRPLGTITEQTPGSQEDTESGRRPLESALASHDPAHFTPIDFDGVPDDGSDPTLTNDPILAADIGLNVPDSGLGPRRDRPLPAAATPGPERDELLESDAVYTAGAAGLTGGIIEYADEEELTGAAGEEPALPDVPDADELAPGSRVDPVSPDPDAMPGTDVLNGSSGEED